MNKLLERQWKRILKNHSSTDAQLQEFKKIVNDTYEEAERERRRKDRSVRLMADELTALNRRIMAKSEAYIATIMSKVADGIIITDDNYKVNSMNQAAELMFGDASNFVNQAFESLLAESGIEKFSHIKEAYMAEGGFLQESTELELEGIKAKGGSFLMEISVNPVSTDDENFFLMILKDITDRKKYQQNLKEAMLKAESASKEKTRFLSNMSHEIRTPMNAVIGLTNLLLENNPREDQLEFLQTVRYSGNNLLAIINDILDFNKIEAGKVELESVPFSFKKIIQSIEIALRPLAAQKNIGLELNLAEELPDHLMGDPVRMSQIVTNLLSNAIKFTAKGKVSFQVDVLKKEEKDIQLMVSVEDTGIGIPEDKLDKIFESFSQSNSDTTRKFGGTGLGLSICKELVDLFGGKLEVESTLDVGSKFFFSVKLPLVDGNNQRLESSFGASRSASNFTGLENKHVLLVEDNKVNQLVAGRFLKKWDITYELAKDGVEACEKILSKDFDLVLMDLNMPNRDGLDATKIIRSMDATYFKEVPIIALTASVVGDVKGKVTEVGMDDYVSKPFKPKELYAVMSAQLQIVEKV